MSSRSVMAAPRPSALVVAPGAGRPCRRAYGLSTAGRRISRSATAAANAPSSCARAAGALIAAFGAPGAAFGAPVRWRRARRRALREQTSTSDRVSCITETRPCFLLCTACAVHPARRSAAPRLLSRSCRTQEHMLDSWWPARLQDVCDAADVARHGARLGAAGLRVDRDAHVRQAGLPARGAPGPWFETSDVHVPVWTQLERLDMPCQHSSSVCKYRHVQ